MHVFFIVVYILEILIISVTDYSTLMHVVDQSYKTNYMAYSVNTNNQGNNKVIKEKNTVNSGIKKFI